MRTFTIAAIAGAIIAGLSLGACSEQSAEPMRVGTNVWPGYEPAYLARDLGFYSPQQVRLSQFQSATETIRAFRNHAIDVVALTLDEALLLIQDALDVKIFLVADISFGGDVILARPTVESTAGLRGKKVGVESSALGAYVLARALEIHGVGFDEVELVYMTVDESEQAYSTGSVDAVVTFEPFRSRLLRKGAREIFSSREMPNEIVDVLVVRTQYAERNPERMKEFTQAWFKAVDFIHNEPAKASRLIGNRLGLSADEALASFEGLVLPDAETNTKLLSARSPVSLVQGAQKLSDVLVKHGLLNRQPSMAGIFTSEFIETSF